ncbi:PAS domain S-box protein [Methanoregula sp.]|uniref:PAS domain S-box protein n=1 Tax=Methanoregula sp. TaxID=2052170 RepID=UPI003566D75B
MSWLQRIIDRDSHNASPITENPGALIQADSLAEFLLISGKPDSAVSVPGNNAASGSDVHAISRKTILVVEDEGIVADDLKETLTSLGYAVSGIAKSGEIALAMVREHSPDLVLMDIHLATAMDGIEASGKIHMLCDIPVIYLTAHADKALLERAKVTDPFGYVIKPYDERELQSTIEIAFYKHDQDLQLRKAYGELEHRVDERTKELSQINRSLKESELRYRSLFEGVPTGLYRAAPSGKILDINPALVQIMGYPDREMLLQVRVPDLFVNAGDCTSWRIPGECQGTVREAELEVRRYDETIIWVRNRESSVCDERGNLLYYNGSVEDITERKRALKALKESEAQLRSVLDNSTDIIYRQNLHTMQYEYYSPSCTETYDFSTDEMSAMREDEVRNRVHPEDRDRLDAFMANLMENDHGRIELRWKVHSGNYHWFSVNMTIIRGGDGHPLYRDGFARDINEQKMAEEELLASEELSREILNNANDGIFLMERTHEGPGKYLLINEKATDMLGYAADEFLQMAPRDIVPADIQKKVMKTVREKLDTVGYATFESVHIRKDGSTYPVEISTHTFRYKGKEVDLSIARDITERKTAEEALQESERKYRQLVDLAQEGIWAIDANGKTTFVNPRMAQMLGYTVEEMQGAHLFSFMDDAGKKIAADHIERRRQGIIEDHEFEFITKQKNRMYAALATASLSDEPGIYKGALAVVSDITRQKAAEMALRESEQRYRNIVEDQTEFICRFLPDQRLTFFNEAYSNYFRLNREECLGNRHPVVLPPADSCLMKNHLAALTPEKPVAVITHRIILPSGEVRWHQWSDRAIFDKNGSVAEYQSVGRDITLQKETETQLKNYQDTLEHRVRERTSELSRTNQKLKKEIEDRKTIQKKLTISSNEKDLLLGEVHHRVKNNLQLIIGLIDLTKTRAHEPAVISTLTDIIVKVQTMGLVHTQLYESKRFDMINMKQQINDLVEMISGFYDHEYLDVTRHIDCDEIYLPVDQAIPCALALNEIISNILKHAFKGRRSGHVEISSFLHGNMIRFVIQDNGVGLPSGFDIEKSNRLGLRLMRTLVEQQLHGRVTLTSKAGTEVVIEFPLHLEEPEDGTCTDS